MEGKIVLVIFPQDAEQKLRPAVVLREFPKYGDVLVCGITSKLYQYIPGFDLLLDSNHPDFKRSNLRSPGVCRLSMLAMIPQTIIKGISGEIGSATHLDLLKTLSDYLIKTKP